MRYWVSDITVGWDLKQFKCDLFAKPLRKQCVKKFDKINVTLESTKLKQRKELSTKKQIMIVLVSQYISIFSGFFIFLMTLSFKTFGKCSRSMFYFAYTGS